MRSRSRNPFDTLLDIQRALEASASSDWLGRSTAAAGSYPPVNVFQREHDLLLVAEMPGVKKEDLQITIKRNQVRIAGKKSMDYGENASIHRHERQFGAFDRTFTLPIEVDADKVKAEYQDGLLALHLPRVEHERPKSIQIS